MQIVTPSTDSLASSLTAAPSVSDDTSTIAHSEDDNTACTLTVTSDQEQKRILFSVVPPGKPSAVVKAKEPTATGTARAALDICCVIDVSGSMGSEATIPADSTTGAPAESTGLSVLDVVKHALRTIASTLQPGEHFSSLILLQYSN